MNTIRVFLFAAILLFGFNACNKDEPTPPATNGSIKIEFIGTPSTGNGNSVSLYFAKDLYHLDQRIFSFSKISNAPHSEILITDVEPQEWYYLQLISTTGAPNETQGVTLVKAGETSTIAVQLF